MTLFLHIQKGQKPNGRKNMWGRIPGNADRDGTAPAVVWHCPDRYQYAGTGVCTGELRCGSEFRRRFAGEDGKDYHKAGFRTD